MLPPIEDSILQSNPKFAALHASLTKNILNPSGSTKHHPAQKERDAVFEALKASRSHASKSHLLLTALTNLDLSPSPSATKRDSREPRPREATQKPLPAELIELILLLSARLTTASLPSSSSKLLESTDQWNSLQRHLPAIGALLSAYLNGQALALARIVSPTTNASFLHRGIPKLVPNIQDLQSQISSKKADLQTRRTALVGKTTTLLSIYHLTISLIIRILEQSKHGAISRHIKTKAEFLNVTAKTVELEMKENGVRGSKMVYTDEVNEALGNYVSCLRDGRERLRERKGDAERVLWGYGVGRQEGEGGLEKEKVMREIARVYGELRRELRDVGRDVERLKGK